MDWTAILQSSTNCLRVQSAERGGAAHRVPIVTFFGSVAYVAVTQPSLAGPE